jgi:hypothetical protein
VGLNASNDISGTTRRCRSDGRVIRGLGDEVIYPMKDLGKVTLAWDSEDFVRTLPIFYCLYIQVSVSYTTFYALLLILIAIQGIYML